MSPSTRDLCLLPLRRADAVYRADVARDVPLSRQPGADERAEALPLIEQAIRELSAQPVQHEGKETR